MPVWFEIVIAVIGSAGTVFGVLGFTGYMAEIAKHRAKKKNKKDDEREAIIIKAQEDKLTNLISEVVNKELTPVKEQINVLDKKATSSLESDVLTLRCQMKTIRDRCHAQKFSDIGDKATMNELYNKYNNLGGNHFVEYVDAWLKEVEKLPDEKVVKTNKKIKNRRG